MSQVSLLSVDSGQSSDMKGVRGDSANKSEAKISAFSDAMEQHYPSKKDKEPAGKVKHDGNLVSKAAIQQPEVNSRNDALKPVKVTETDDAHTLPVPLPKDDESLTAKLIDNDNAHTLPVPLPTDDESLVTRSTASYDAHTLPVPVMADDEKLIFLSKPTGDEHTLPVPVSPLAVTDKSIEKADGALNSDPQVLSNQRISSLDFQSQTQNASENNAVNDDAVDLLKMLNGAQQLLTKSSAENTQNETGTKSAHLTAEQMLASNKDTAQAKKLTAEQVSLPSNASDSSQTKLLVGNNNTANQFTENTAGNAVDSAEKISDLSNAKHITAAQVATTLVASKQEEIDEQLISKQARSNVLSQEMNVVLDKNQDAKQIVDTRNVHNVLVDEADLASAKQALSVELNAESKVLAVENHDAKVSTLEAKLSNVAEFKRANDNEQKRTVNQSTASAIASSTTDSKLDVNQKSAMSDEVSKLANSVNDTEKLGKNEGEKPALQPEKITSTFNQTLAAQAEKPMASAGELAADQEQAFENAINTLTTNTVSTQKSITTMNTETIAIYRKDFADTVKDKVMVMINQKIQQVEIQLDPPEMGNIHVRVNLQNEQAAVQFVVQNQQAKDALEQNMAKLRDMLAESGVDVGEASIEQRQAQEQNNEGFDGQANRGEGGESDEAMGNKNDNSVLNQVKASSTGIDYYA